MDTLSVIWRTLEEQCQRMFGPNSSLYPPPDLTRDEALRYLYQTAHDDPDRWVCETCLQLYPVCRSDTPSNPSDTPCKHQQRMTVNFKPRHVQMTLKYTRLAQQGDLSWVHYQHLDNLLASQWQAFYASSVPRVDPRPQVWCEHKPFVQEGMYTVRASNWYRKADLGGPVSTMNMGRSRICEHQFFDFDVPGWRDRPMSLLCMLIEEALLQANDGRELRGQCEWCDVAFVICHKGNALNIVFHKNLGFEVSASYNERSPSLQDSQRGVKPEVLFD